MRLRPASSARRNGAATVELSVCLPLLLLIVAGSIETCSLIYLSEALSVAAYESARMLAVPDSESEPAMRRAREILEARNIAEEQITVTPNDVTSLDPGTEFSVTVSVPAHTNSLLPGFLFADRRIESTVTFVKE